MRILLDCYCNSAVDIKLKLLVFHGLKKGVLEDWVLKTASEHLIRTACDPKDTLKGWYGKLKEQVGVSATKQKRDARSLYKTELALEKKCL
jgi:hypothetical protein